MIDGMEWSPHHDGREWGWGRKKYWRFRLSNLKNDLIKIAICVYQI
jgi:hypothetical protein